MIWEEATTPQTPHWLQLGAPYSHSPPSRKYPFPWTNPQTQRPASSLDPFEIPSQTPSTSDQPFCHNAQVRQTDRQTHTNSWRECSIIYSPLYRERRGLIIRLMYIKLLEIDAVHAYIVGNERHSWDVHKRCYAQHLSALLCPHRVSRSVKPRLHDTTQPSVHPLYRVHAAGKIDTGVCRTTSVPKGVRHLFLIAY